MPTTSTGGVINTGSSLAGTEYLSKAEAVPMKNQSEDIVDNYIEQTPYQNMLLAFELIMQALMTMPAMSYISFALSLVFMFMWLINPMSYLSKKEENQTKRIARKSHRTHKSSQPSNR